MKASTVLSFLTERRSNPELNPRVGLLAAIRDHEWKAASTRDFLPGSKKILNSFISFTMLDKLGINPTTEFDTPLGIYSYPTPYIEQLLSSGASPSEVVPFAGEQKYANLFSVTGNIIDVATIDGQQVEELYSKLPAALQKLASGQVGETLAANVPKHIEAAAGKASVNKLPGGRLWYVTRAVSLEAGKLGFKATTFWNKLFRTLGIAGVLDTGAGIIHRNEPTQLVVFSSAAIVDNKRVYNKYTANHQLRRRSIPKQLEQFYTEYNAASSDQLMQVLGRHHTMSVKASLNRVDGIERKGMLLAAGSWRHYQQLRVTDPLRPETLEIMKVAYRTGTRGINIPRPFPPEFEQFIATEFPNDYALEVRDQFNERIAIAAIRRNPKILQHFMRWARAVPRIAELVSKFTPVAPEAAR